MSAPTPAEIAFELNAPMMPTKPELRPNSSAPERQTGRAGDDRAGVDVVGQPREDGVLPRVRLVLFPLKRRLAHVGPLLPMCELVSLLSVLSAE